MIVLLSAVSCGQVKCHLKAMVIHLQNFTAQFIQDVTQIQFCKISSTFVTNLTHIIGSSVFHNV